MSAPPPGDAVCVTCRCGKRAIIESRWFNKRQGCAGCQREFMVMLIQDRDRWKHVVAFAEEGPAPSAQPPPAAETSGPWFNVTCTCGRKIGLDRRLAGRVTRCAVCNEEILIRLQPMPDGDATQIIRGVRPPSEAGLRPPRPADVSPPPAEMHLLCTCGEELLIVKEYYDATIACGACGVRLALKLKYDSERNRHELEASVVPNEDPGQDQGQAQDPKSEPPPAEP